MQNNNPEVLRVLVPDGKHVREQTAEILRASGYPVQWHVNGSVVLHIEVDGKPFPVSFTQQKNALIPVLVAERRNFAVGLTTTDSLADYMLQPSRSAECPSRELEALTEFDIFSKSLRVSLLTRREDDQYKSPKDLRNKSIATPYVGLTANFFRQYFPDENTLPITLDARRGGEEGLVRAYNADAAIVAVDSGSARDSHDLKELEVVIPEGQIKLVLICNPVLSGGSALLQSHCDEFVQRVIEGYKLARSVPLAASSVGDEGRPEVNSSTSNLRRPYIDWIATNLFRRPPFDNFRSL